MLASYVDPVLPWPVTPDTMPEAGNRALALARVFHRGHSADWCRTSSVDGIEALRARASDVSLDAPTRAAACEVCSEFAVRHLRVGTPARYDSSAEPLCHYLSGGPYLYQRGRAYRRLWPARGAAVPEISSSLRLLPCVIICGVGSAPVTLPEVPP